MNARMCFPTLAIGAALAACTSSHSTPLPNNASSDARRPLDRQQVGAQWNVYRSPALAYINVLIPDGQNLLGVSASRSAFVLFKPSAGQVLSVTTPPPYASATVQYPISAIVGSDSRVYFVPLSSGNVFGRFSQTDPPQFDYCTLPAAPTGGLVQDPVTNTMYVDDYQGYVDSVTWGAGACTVSPTRFQDPDPGFPFGLAIGWNDHLFVGDVSGHILEVSNNTLVHDYPMRNAGGTPPVGTEYLVTGLMYDSADNQIWFQDPNQLGIGRITSDGTITLFGQGGGLSTGINYGTTPQSMTMGPDGNVWSAPAYSDLWSIAPNASSYANVTTLTPPGALPVTYLTGIAVGSDHQVYASDVNTNRVYAYNYLHMSLSPQSVTVAAGATTYVSVSETNYGGAFRAGPSPLGVVRVKMRSTTNGYRLSVHGLAPGTATVKVWDAYGNYTELPVTVN